MVSVAKNQKQEQTFCNGIKWEFLRGINIWLTLAFILMLDSIHANLRDATTSNNELATAKATYNIKSRREVRIAKFNVHVQCNKGVVNIVPK